mmetsp:Transcript_146451/g.469859  ORF Transcript_146451/g.469859 Transcript_146451/m.469859 type:complete len:87 (+) Transcript_146451:163-423(+)
MSLPLTRCAILRGATSVTRKRLKKHSKSHRGQHHYAVQVASPEEYGRQYWVLKLPDGSNLLNEVSAKSGGHVHSKVDRLSKAAGRH